eukprot:TRINITY_DN5764_c0_g1_i1.p1 TRINITY_DN5764_c0_g1~~TRINITY_DN5764_c0_g1_i1.p1  ORF type:complete len:293 (-),score=58.51 TRINITY_DN5764_c0_g1_i1:45-860(-)
MEQTWGQTKVDSLFDVKGKIVLVTGGGRGIGFMIAQGFVENGAKVIISSRNRAECEKTAAELNRRGPGSCYAITADLSKAEECKKLGEEIAKKESHLNILVNNSGAVWGEDYNTYPESAFDKLWAINVKAIFFLTRACTALLEKGAQAANSPSRVINIGSIDGIRISSLETYAYSATKAGVHHMTKHLANKLVEKNINVNAIACGFFPTKMTKVMSDAWKEGAGSESMMIKRPGGVTDISGTVIWLSSKAGAWVTGTIVTLDGGTTAKASL